MKQDLIKQSWNGTTLRLRFTSKGERYTLTVPRKLQNNKDLIETVQNTILSDLLLDTVDATLVKYVDLMQPQIALPFVETSSTTINVPQLFQQFLKATGIDPVNSLHHYATYQMIHRWDNSPGREVLTLYNLTTFFTEEALSASTFNKRKTHLKQFYEWLIRTGKTVYNPITDIKSRSLPKALPDNHKPFSEGEIVQILDALRNNKCCPQKNQFKHSYYYLFVKFIFHTGARVGEACALRVRNLDLQKGTAFIEEAWGTQTNQWKKIRNFKKTKGEDTRYVYLSHELTDELSEVVQDRKGSDLVFPSPRNSVIDSSNFNDRVFFPLLRELNIPQRVIYAGRHSFASLAVKQEVYLPSLQYQMGHRSINTTMKYYTQFRQPPSFNMNRPSDKKTPEL